MLAAAALAFRFKLLKINRRLERKYASGPNAFRSRSASCAEPGDAFVVSLFVERLVTRELWKRLKNNTFSTIRT